MGLSGSIEKYLTEKYVNAWQRNEWLAGLADRNKRKAKNTSGSTTGGGAASTAPAGSSTALAKNRSRRSRKGSHDMKGWCR